MKTIVKNGKKYTVTNTLYENIKRKCLLEDGDPRNNPTNNNQASNNPTNNTIASKTEFQGRYDNDDREVENYQLSEEEKQEYNNLRKLFAKNIKNCIEYKKFRQIIPISDLERYNELFNYMFKIVSNTDNNYEIQRMFFNYAKRNNITDTKQLLEQMVIFSLGNVRDLSKGQLKPTTNDEKFFQYAAIDDKVSIENINNYILYNKILKDIRKKVRTILNPNLRVNNDNNEINDIDALKLIDNTLGKENVQKATIEKVSDKIGKNDNITRKEVENAIRDQMSGIIINATYGEFNIKFENVSKDDLHEVGTEIAKLIKDKNYVPTKNNTNSSDLHAAIIEAKQICDKNGWETEQINDACKTAAENHEVNWEEVKEHLLTELKHTSNIKQIEGVMNKVERNDIVISTLKSTKHTIDKKLTDLFKSFYDILTNKDFLSSQYTDNIDDYFKSLRNGLYTLYDQQDKFIKIIKNYNNNFSNPYIISSIIKYINNNVHYYDDFVKNDNLQQRYSKMERLLQILENNNDNYNNAKKSILTVDYSDIENAERNVDDFLDSLQPQEINITDFSDDGMLKDFDSKSSTLESGEFLKTYKELFTTDKEQGTSKVNMLLIDYNKMSFAILMKLIINNAFLISKREGKNNIEGNNKNITGDLSNLLKIFRFLMGRTVGEKDIDLYEEVKNNIKDKKINSKRFINDINKIYEKLFLKFNIKITTHLKINRKELLDYFISKFNSTYGNKNSNENMYEENNEYTDLRRIFAYTLLSEYANKNKQIYDIDEDSDEIQQNDTVNMIIAHIVPQNESDQITSKDFNDMCYTVHVKDINQLNRFCTEITGDEKLKNNYNVDLKFMQESFENYVKYLYATDKENNFVSIVKIQVLFGKTRNILNKISPKTGNIADFGNRFQNIFK